MEDNKKRVRKFSSWISDTSKSIDREDEIFAVKKIVMKILRYMEENHMTQKELAEKLGVTPQYISKFLHGQDCDIKISTVIRYGRILNLKLVEIPDDSAPQSTGIFILHTIKDCEVRPISQKQYRYNSVVNHPYKLN
ncbi:MAG: helix-turn-helix transcriptional regulator [Duncaniella sp.]|nr:helix-turn-helix transcriptional regulator [Duncaniella sp.]